VLEGNFPYGIKKKNRGPKKAMFSMGANFREGGARPRIRPVKR